MKKTILYVGNFKLPYGTAAAQRVKINKLMLEEYGYNVKFVSTFEKTSKTSIHENFSINNVYPNKYLHDIKYLKDIVEDYGVVNIHSVIFYNFPAISLWKAQKYLNKKKIKVFADCTEWYGIPRDTNHIKAIIKVIDTELRMRFVHKKMDGIICISEYLEKYYRKLKVNTVLIPNLVDLNDEKWCVPVEVSGNSTINFVYAGNPGKSFEKENLDLIVDVFNNIKVRFENINLEIIGITEEIFLRTYIKKNKKTPVLENIIFHGRLAHLDVIHKVQSSDYFIFFRPKTKANIAGFPTKMVESFSALTPVVTNNIGDINKYIEDEINGYLLEISDFEKMEMEIDKIIRKHDKHHLLKKHLKENNPFDYKKYLHNLKQFLS